MTSQSQNPAQTAPTASPAKRASEEPKVMPAQSLFAGCREVIIEHEGARYRLRITRRNKLILQK